MTAARRTRSNFALERAIDWAQRLRKPLVVVEPLQREHQHHSQRLEDFVVRGMRDNFAAFAGAGIRYIALPGLSRAEAGRRWRAAAASACAVVLDDWPCYFVRDANEAMARSESVYVELVDSCGLIPLQATPKAFARAHDFRRWWQREFASFWTRQPLANPLAKLELPAVGALPPKLTGDAPSLPEREGPGGPVAARERLDAFVSNQLPGYADRNHPDVEVQSRLSPYLHWGHMGAHEVAWSVLQSAGWDEGRLGDLHRGQREGWWGLPAAHEGFMDQLLTWRELGLNFCWHKRDHYSFASLPAWAQRTLNEHREDERPYLYTLEAFESASTHDQLWNAAQRELVQTGHMHNYLRMLWGKKILHWSESPRAALEIMIELNNKYALDGRDPNSYSGIFWVLGRFDRAWGPERDVFGKIRYMTSESTRRKLRVNEYIERWNE